MFDCAQDKAIAHSMHDKIMLAKHFYEQELAPSDEDFIMTKIELLESRYFEKEIDDATQAKMSKEWVQDLTEYPADLIDEACRNWRRANQTYAPRSAGVLMESVKEKYVKRRCVYKNAVTVLELLG